MKGGVFLMSGIARYELRRITLDKGIFCAKEWVIKNLPKSQYLEALETIAATAEFVKMI